VLTGWRITKERFADDIFGGEGARIYGGRWNSPDRWAVYTSATAALAVVETLANHERPELLGAFVIAFCSFDESLVTRLEIDKLPVNWTAPEPPRELQMIGDEWIHSERSAVLSVPSVIVKYERNYLLNPAHDDFKRIKFSAPEPFHFDLRIVT